MSKKQTTAVKQITPGQYAQIRGITLGAVTKQIRAGNKLPGIANYVKFGRMYILNVEDNFTELFDVVL